MLPDPHHIHWHGNITLYGSDGEYTRERAFRFLDGLGMSPCIPGTSNVLVVVESGESVGNRADVPQAEFRRLADSKTQILFKAWLDDRDDMLCDLRRGSWGWAECYYVGNLQMGGERVAERLIARFEAEIEQGGRRMLFLDWGNETEDFDWDAFWQGQLDYTETAPDLIGVPRDLESRFRPSTIQPFLRLERRGHIIFRRERGSSHEEL